MSFLRSNYEMKHATLSKTKPARGVVIQFPRLQITTRGAGNGWEVRLDKVELTNQSDRLVRLCMTCFFRDSGESDRCKLRLHEEGVDGGGEDQLLPRPVEDYPRVDLFGIFGGGPDQGVVAPMFDYLEVTDRACSPPQTVRVEELPQSVELFCAPRP